MLLPPVSAISAYDYHFSAFCRSFAVGLHNLAKFLLRYACIAGINKVVRKWVLPSLEIRGLPLGLFLTGFPWGLSLGRLQIASAVLNRSVWVRTDKRLLAAASPMPVMVFRRSF